MASHPVRDPDHSPAARGMAMPAVPGGADGVRATPVPSPPARARNALWTVAVALAYVALGVVLFWHAWAGGVASTAQIGGDQIDTMWFLTWVPYSIGHGLDPFFTTFANHPAGVNLLANTSVLLLGLVSSPVTELWGPVASYNLLATLALPASALAGYALARRLVPWRPAAFVAGLVYGFSPYQVAQMTGGHLNLAFNALPPLAFLAVHEIVVRQRSSARRAGIALGLVLTAQFFVSSEILASTVVVGAICVATVAIVGRAQVRTHLRHALVGTGWAAGVGAALLAYPVWFALAGPAHIAGRIQQVPQAYRADLLGPVIPDSNLLFAPRHLAQIADHFANAPVENGSYLGITLLVALVVSTFVLWRRSPVVRVAAVAGTAAFVVSLGAGLVVKTAPPPTPSGFPLPGRIFTWLPVLDNAAPVRYSLFVALFAAIVLAAFVAAVHDRVVERGLGRPAALGGPAAIALVALLPLVPSGAAGGMVPAGIPTYFTGPAVNRIEPGSVAVVLPYPLQRSPNAQLWQAWSGPRFAMPGGYYLVPQGPSHRVSFTPELAFARDTLSARVFAALDAGHPPARTPALRGALLAEWRSWHVGTVVAIPAATSDPAATITFCTWLTGRPGTTEPGGAVAWYHLAGAPAG